MLAAVKNPQPKPRGATSIELGDLAERRPVAMLHAGLDLSRMRLNIHLPDEQGATIQVT